MGRDWLPVLNKLSDGKANHAKKRDEYMKFYEKHLVVILAGNLNWILLECMLVARVKKILLQKKLWPEPNG